MGMLGLPKEVVVRSSQKRKVKVLFWVQGGHVKRIYIAFLALCLVVMAQPGTAASGRTYTENPWKYRTRGVPVFFSILETWPLDHLEKHLKSFEEEELEELKLEAARLRLEIDQRRDDFRRNMRSCKKLHPTVEELQQDLDLLDQKSNANLAGMYQRFIARYKGAQAQELESQFQMILEQTTFFDPEPIQQTLDDLGISAYEYLESLCNQGTQG